MICWASVASPRRVSPSAPTPGRGREPEAPGPSAAERLARFFERRGVFGVPLADAHRFQAGDRRGQVFGGRRSSPPRGPGTLRWAAVFSDRCSRRPAGTAFRRSAVASGTMPTWSWVTPKAARYWALTSRGARAENDSSEPSAFIAPASARVSPRASSSAPSLARPVPSTRASGAVGGFGDPRTQGRDATGGATETVAESPERGERAVGRGRRGEKRAADRRIGRGRVADLGRDRRPPRRRAGRRSGAATVRASPAVPVRSSSRARPRRRSGRELRSRGPAARVISS